MKLIYGDCGSGKTKQILELSSQTKTSILCESEARKLRLLEKAKGYGIRIPLPIVYTEGCEGRDVLVDDPKRLLEAMLHANLVGLTVNVSQDDVTKL